MSHRVTGFHITDASVRAGEKILLDCPELRLPPGRVCGVIGRNGAGKSTLLRLLARHSAPGQGGLVRLDGQDISAMPAQAFARRVAHMAQSTPLVEAMRLRDLVALGRYPWHGAFGRMRREDEASVTRALRRTGLEALADRALSGLSGGEMQRARLAMILAQGSDWLILDEPSAALDLVWALELLTQVRSLAQEGRGVVIALHDMNMAARFCDDLLAIHHGSVLVHGPVDAVFRPDLMSQIFDVPVGIGHVAGHRVAVPLAEV